MEIRSAHRVHLRPLPAQGEDIQDELQRTGLSQLLLPGRPPGLVIHHESFLTRLTEVYAIDTTTQTNALSNLHTVLRETVLRRGWRKVRCVSGLPVQETAHHSPDLPLKKPPLSRSHGQPHPCLLYTSDAADDLLCVDLGGRRIINKKTSIPSPIQ